MMDEAKKNVMQLRSLFFILCESDLGKIYVAHGFLFFERMAAFGRYEPCAISCTCTRHHNLKNKFEAFMCRRKSQACIKSMRFCSAFVAGQLHNRTSTFFC